MYSILIHQKAELTIIYYLLAFKNIEKRSSVRYNKKYSSSLHTTLINTNKYLTAKSIFDIETSPFLE